MKNEEIINVSRSELKKFRYHPYLVKEDEDFANLVKSIKENGVISPLIVRKVRDEKVQRYEILSGHRRFKACQILKIERIPVIVKQMSMPDASIYVVDSNLHREDILPSERAYAYKLKMEALYHKGEMTYDELTKSPLETSYNTDSAKEIAKQEGTSRAQVFRYVRLTYLNKGLLDMVDCKTMGFRPAVEISYLKMVEQEILLQAIEDMEASPTLSQAQLFKKASKNDEFNEDLVYDLLSREKPNQKEQLRIKMEELSDFFPRGTTPEEMKEWITRLLKENEYDLDDVETLSNEFKF